MDTYITDENTVDSNSDTSRYIIVCSSFLGDVIDSKYLRSTRISTNDEQNYEYINYWLNDKLEKIMSNTSIKVKEFYLNLVKKDDFDKS
ncbi:hypothetical protein POVCU2_0092530 [Plasmodium ovale curtisi]|uniref:PIR Superfamily Protein n=1 Tax=Plasmodium ovale curtisi TaxID=864141 RepID=A0A1A8WRV5_PLAOA|nr:hypothetical protein POVCU2_0092530 [Plasmodium ovale curtisi]SBT03037.1 hypothetical protein POVCU1_083450 [Plasmodium ovale curtisi]